MITLQRIDALIAKLEEASSEISLLRQAGEASLPARKAKGEIPHTGMLLRLEALMEAQSKVDDAIELVQEAS